MVVGGWFFGLGWVLGLFEVFNVGKGVFLFVMYFSIDNLFFLFS